MSLQLSPRDRLIIEEARRRGLIGKKETPQPSFPDWYKTTIPRHWGYPRHIAFICDLVQRVIDGELRKVALSLPPGHAKSATVTQRLPIYWGLTHPHDTTVLTGYSQTFAERNLSKPARAVAEELGVLDPSTTAMSEWNLANGARIMARGVGAAPTGINPITLLVADDPIKDRQQANSEVERQNIKDWWDGSIVQRFWPETRVFLIATRWHEDDLIGHIRAKDDPDWTFINLPAIAEDDDPLGRKPGEALWPEGKPIELLESIRRNNPWEFEALFQGNPTPREGSFFRVTELQFEDEAPPMVATARAWDIGASADGDPTAGVKLGRDKDGAFWVLDVVRGQWPTDRRNDEMRLTAGLDGPRVPIGIPQDPGAAGKDMALAMVRMLAGFSVTVSPVSGDKVTRADPVSAQVNAGNVRVLRRPWTGQFVEELRQFPNGKHDDQVDAFADAFKMVLAPPKGGSNIRPRSGRYV